MSTMEVRHLVLWSILGPGALLLTMILVGTLAGFLGGNGDSWVTTLGMVLYYACIVGIFLVAHAFALFGLVGILVLSWRQFPGKVLTVSVCLGALILSLPVLTLVYFNAKLPFGL